MTDAELNDYLSPNLAVGVRFAAEAGLTQPTKSHGPLLQWSVGFRRYDGGWIVGPFTGDTFSEALAKLSGG